MKKDEVTETDSRKRPRSKLIIIIVVAVLMVGALTGMAAAVLNGGGIGDEASLRRRLAAEGSDTIEINGEIEISEPLVINGNKELTGNGVIRFSDDVAAQENLTLLLLSNGCVNDKRLAGLPSVLTVAPGANLKLSGSVTVDGAKAGHGVEVQQNASLYMQGKAAVQNSVHNVRVAEGGRVTMTGGKLCDALLDGLLAQPGAALELSGGSIIANAGHGIHNMGNAVIQSVTMNQNEINLLNEGAMSVSKLSLESSSGDAVRNVGDATLSLKDIEILNTGGTGIRNLDGATLEIEGLLIRRTGSRGIENAGGTINGSDITIYSCGTVPLENRPGTGDVGGDVTIDNLTISGASGMNIVQGVEGTMTLTNSSFGLTSVTNVRLITGTLVLDHIMVEGTTSTGAGIWTTGGRLEISNSTIKDTKGRGLALAGGVIEGRNLTIDNVASVGIDNMPNNDGITTATVHIVGVTITNGLRDNIANTSGGRMVITNATLGVTPANSVRVTDGALTLNNVRILGTVADETTSSYHGIYSRGGTVYLNRVSISNCVAGGIRNRGGNIIGNNVTIRNTKGCAVSSGTFSDGKYGNVTIHNLTISGSQLGNILNECPGTMRITNATLGPCVGNSIMIKDGVMSVENFVAQGTLASATSAAHHGVYLKGGRLTLTNGIIRNAISSGVRNVGGYVTLNQVKIENSAANNLSASAGTSIFNDCILEICPRTNFNLTGPGAIGIINNTRILGAGDDSGSNNVNCVYIAPGAVCTVKGDSLITGSVTRAGVLNEGGTFYFEGGEITGNAQRGVNNANGEKDGVTYIARFLMSGGEIDGNGNNTVSGGGVYNGGEFVMTGGSIHHNTSNTGGGINTAAGSITEIKGGAIYKNTAVATTSSNGNGGGIHASTGAMIKLTGGHLYDNMADRYGDGVCHNAALFSVGGTAVIEKDNDVYLAAGKSVAVDGKTIGNTPANPLTISAAVTQYGAIVVTSDSESVIFALKSCFAVKNNAFSIAKLNTDLAIGTVDDGFVFVAQIGTTKYATLQDAINAVPTTGAETTIEIIGDITLTAMVDISGTGRNIVLTDDGNGPYTISRAASFTSGRMILLRTGNTMTVRGSSGSDAAPSLIFDGGNISCGNDSQIIAVGASATNYNATMNLQAGVKLMNGNNANGGGAIIANGTLNMTGGVITGCTSRDASVGGGGIYIGANGAVTMTGGTIAGNNATTAAKGIYNAGSLSIGGAAVVDHIYLPANKTIAVSADLTAVSAANPITVTMSAYAAGTQVLTGMTTLNNTKFVPANAGFTIGTDGKLAGATVYVAQIGTTKYATLQDAVNAVPTNGAATTIEIISNIELSAMVDISGTGRNIVLTDDGNGPYSISRAASFTSGRMILLRTGNTMTVRGSSGSDAAPSLIFDGGNISCGNDSQIIAVGASATNYNATMNLQAGVKLMNGNNANGGGAIIANGTLNMTGGVITGCTSRDASVGGGGIYIGANGAVTMTGGTIAGNNATTAAKGIYNAGSLSIGGAAVVDHIYLPANKTIAVSADLTAVSAANPITVTMSAYAAGTQVLTGMTTLNNTKFVPANAGFTIGTDGKLAGATVYVAQIGTAKYATLQDAINAVPTTGAETTIEIISNITLTAMVDISGTGRNIVLTDDGNGPYTISRAASFTSGRMILLRMGNTLTMRGSGGSDTEPSLIFDGGNISCGNDSQIIAVGASATNYNATMNLQAGVKLMNGNNANGGGAIIANGTLNMTGGVITGCTSRDASVGGGGVYIGANGAVTVTGGTIAGNNATTAAKGIYNAGSLTIGGAAVVDHVYLPANKTIAVSADLTAVSAASPITVTLSAYTAGTQIITGMTAVNNTKFVPANAGFTIGTDGKLAAV